VSDRYLRLAQPGQRCTHCSATLGTSLVCPGCGWIDPAPALAEAEAERPHECFQFYRHGDPSPWTCPGCGTVWQVRASRWEALPRTTFTASIHPDDVDGASSHVRLIVRGGRTPGSRALLGQLTCERGEEADLLLARINAPTWCV
jgi:predicted RNA-binding Zn-ribbon protein involved in translation (DUF1610 family)